MLLPTRRLAHDLSLLVLGLWLGCTPAWADPPPSFAQPDPLARAIFKELIETNTTRATTPAAEAMAARLVKAGVPGADIAVLGPTPEKKNLVARLRGHGTRRPLLLLAHLDVVEARKEDWSQEYDPFHLTEDAGYFYGRGTSDDKAMAAMWTTIVCRLAERKTPLDRDVILALTADEEGGHNNGVDWLLGHHRPLLDAAFALNEGGGGDLKHDRYVFNEIQASEKIYQTFSLEVTNRGGHSSLPREDNAIYQLADALERLHRFNFRPRLSPVTRGYLREMAVLEPPSTAADMRRVAAGQLDLRAVARLSRNSFYNSLLHTTCVATRLEAGHADNALPQKARATINCRLLPEDAPADVLRTLERVIDDEAVVVRPLAEALSAPESPLSDEIVRPIERLTHELWPTAKVVPSMSMGASDGLYLRRAGIPTYGTGPFGDMDDIRAHGKDERLRVRDFDEGLVFLDRLVRALAATGG
jgi:acetylornithine deacetylase/succinyl-diaminopimelate desuccinylase-like protein